MRAWAPSFPTTPHTQLLKTDPVYQVEVVVAFQRGVQDAVATLGEGRLNTLLQSVDRDTLIQVRAICARAPTGAGTDAMPAWAQ
jgi:hypothetical protein